MRLGVCGDFGSGHFFAEFEIAGLDAFELFKHGGYLVVIYHTKRVKQSRQATISPF